MSVIKKGGLYTDCKAHKVASLGEKAICSEYRLIKLSNPQKKTDEHVVYSLCLCLPWQPNKSLQLLCKAKREGYRSRARER